MSLQQADEMDVQC